MNTVSGQWMVCVGLAVFFFLAPTRCSSTAPPHPASSPPPAPCPCLLRRPSPTCSPQPSHHFENPPPLPHSIEHFHRPHKKTRVSWSRASTASSQPPAPPSLHLLAQPGEAQARATVSRLQSFPPRHPTSLSVSSRRVAPRHCSSSSSSRQLRVAAAVRQSRPPLLALLGLRRCLRPHDCEGSAAAYLSRGKQTTSRPTSAGTGWARRRGTRISTGRSRQPDQLCHVQRQQVRHRPEVQYPSVEVSTASTSSREARAII